jgi:hypothetical protein
MTEKCRELLRDDDSGGSARDQTGARRIDCDVKGIHGDLCALLNVGICKGKKLTISPFDSVRVDIMRLAPALRRVHAATPSFPKLSQETANPRPDPHTTSRSKFGTADAGNRLPFGRWALRGFATIRSASGIGIAAIIWLGSPGDAAKTGHSQLAALAQTAPTGAALRPELTRWRAILPSWGKNSSSSRPIVNY